MFIIHKAIFFLPLLLLNIACYDQNCIEETNNVTCIPDSNFERKLIELGIDSDNKINQQILTKDAESVTSLDLNLDSNFGKIKSLHGIENFTNLTFLSAANQKIKTIDLSANTQIDSLYIHGNYLTEIDLSKNTNLIDINIQANKLHRIQGLSYATKLKVLDISWNNLKNFNLDNKSVEVLFISHNLLQNIQLYNAPKLTNILLTTNQLTYIDLSRNTELRTLLISNNQLLEINLENNTNLTHFYSSSNLLSELNVSYNQKLIDLRIDRNPYLSCIKKSIKQYIPTVSLSDYQTLSNHCN